ncbi:MAG: chitobiase/beta-hexosaminidase C-terminal domain-containing protein [Cellulosilyticum sp.]|nr:chitobiase/beta-hexosaminidase C-terminal domain-containing protein [Cellulosilyticum sp.]
MNKRLTYLLTVLLMAQTCSPISAQPLEINSPNRVFTAHTLQTTTDSSIEINRPTTGPSIEINRPTTSATITCVTVNADSISNGDTLTVSAFSNEYISLKVQLQGTAFKDPKADASSIAYYIENSLNLEPSEDIYEHQKLSSLYINNEAEMILNLKAAHIDLDSLGHALTFTIPHYLLTTTKDVTVTVPIVYDIPLPDSSVLVTSNPVLASDIAGGCFTISAQLLNTAFIDPQAAASYLHPAILSSLNLKTLDGNNQFSESSSVTVNNETEFVFNMAATNIDPKSIPNILTFKIPGYLLTQDKAVVVRVPVIHDKVAQPTISLPEGKYNGIQHVTLDCTTPNVQIRYTLDGSEVTLNSRIYKPGQPIALKYSGTLKVVAYKGTMPSETALAQYTIIRPSSSESVNSASVSNSQPSLDHPSSSTVKEDPLVVPSLTPNNSEISSTDISSDTTGKVNDSVILSDSVKSIIASQKRQLNSKVQVAQYGLAINNQKLDLKNNLLISNGRTLVPIRALSDALNLPIQYHQATKTAVIQTNDMVLEFPLGYNVAIVNGEIMPLDANNTNVISTLQNNKAYLPISFIAQKLNLNLYIDNQNIHLTSNSN